MTLKASEFWEQIYMQFKSFTIATQKKKEFYNYNHHKTYPLWVPEIQNYAEKKMEKKKETQWHQSQVLILKATSGYKNDGPL